MSSSQYPHFRSEAELRAGVLIWQIVSPILLIFGTMGNVLSIIVLSDRKFNRWSSTVYLLGLTVADLCALYIGLLRQWVKYSFDLDIRHVHPVFCKIHWWLMYTCLDVPVWILTTITVERLISTACPYRSKAICTKNRAKIGLILIVVSALTINSHLLYGFGTLEIAAANETLVISCAPLTDTYGQFFSKVWTWIDLCKFCLVPFTLLSTGNICIIYKLVSIGRKVKTKVAHMTSQTQSKVLASTSQTQDEVLATISQIQAKVSPTTSHTQTESSSRTSQAQAKVAPRHAKAAKTTSCTQVKDAVTSSKTQAKVVSTSSKSQASVMPTSLQTTHASSGRTSNMTILLLCLNFVFIISTAPVSIYFIGEPYWIPKDVPRDIQLQDPWWAIVNMLMYISNSFNFILYCLAGSRFRDSVKELLSKRTRSPCTRIVVTPASVGNAINSSQRQRKPY